MSLWHAFMDGSLRHVFHQLFEDRYLSSVQRSTAFNSSSLTAYKLKVKKQGLRGQFQFASLLCLEGKKEHKYSKTESMCRKIEARK